MKKVLKVLLIVLLFNACKNNQQQTHNGLPIVKATKQNIDYKIDDTWSFGRWGIAPQVAHDTLPVICYKQNQEFTFKTDIDSISFNIKPNTTKSFYVVLKNSLYAHTIIKGVPFKANQITHDTTNKSNIIINYSTDANSYLKALKNEYPLDFINNNKSEIQTVLETLNWTNSRWKHNGNNTPKQQDAISILNEAKQGGEFPCFAYAIVLKDQLNANGYKARTVYLKTEDAAYRKGSPGHVATEVFLKDSNKWAFIDGQFNVMPTLNGTPLNAVQFQNAINNNYQDLVLESLGKEVITKRNYITFVYDYLFYLDTTLNNSYSKNESYTINGKKSLMLVPLAAQNLTKIDFWKMDVDYCLYTNAIQDFYAKPVSK